MPLLATRGCGAPRAFNELTVRSRDEVTHETEGRWLVDPGADPASVSDVRRLEETETLNQERLFLRSSTDGDARSAPVDL
jgi:hypothetical protein